MNNRSDDFDNAFEILVLNEGGYSDDPVDPGGKTIYGITMKNHPETFARVFYLFASGHKNLALQLAKQFYKRNYWNDLYKEIPDSTLAFKLFDLGVNKGKVKAVKSLQRVLKYIFLWKIKVDGAFGKRTLGTIQATDQEELYNEYVKAHADHYASLKTAWKYLRGWLKRLNRRHEI